MKIEINIEKKHLFVFIALSVLIIGIFFVIAYGGNNPSVVGHSIGELNLSPIYVVNDKVGIGTSNPQAKLDVEGDINVKGDISIPGLKRNDCYWTNWGCGEIICNESLFVAGVNFSKYRSRGCDNSFDEPYRRLFCCKL